jgi:hypothetical protein
VTLSKSICTTWGIVTGLTVCAAIAPDLCVAEDLPTGAYYEGKSLALPTFPYRTNVGTVRGPVEIIVERPFGKPLSRHLTDATTPASGADSAYWIVGPAAWEQALRPVLLGRRALGRPTAWRAIEELLAHYADVGTPAARLRAALRDGHAQGVRYALLVGDHHHLPLCYASDEPAQNGRPLDMLQICDLYFGEFNGHWDLDGDGLYGEPGQDSADLWAEILIGRVPLAHEEEARDWARKWEDYVFARGDTTPLGRALGLMADQMRDFESGAGQAAAIARSWPREIAQDSLTLAESPSGIDPDPLGPWADDVVKRWDVGWGIVHIYAHGRWDGFTLKTSGYGDWPTSYLLTAREPALPHAGLGRLSGSPGFVYSVACHQAAFDAEVALGTDPQTRCVAAELLANPEGGAVTFVGYSRWGWVYSSYLVAQAFWEGVFDSGYVVAGALQYAKLQYPYLLDIAYGHNVYGDPALDVWLGNPDRLDLSAPERISAAGGPLDARVLGVDAPASTIITLLAGDGTLLGRGLTDTTGTCRLVVPPLAIQTLTLTASRRGYVPERREIAVTLTTAVEDRDVRPVGLQLHNHPNPFNVATRVTFGPLPPGRWRLEVYNLLGRLVRRWSLTPADIATGLTWDGRDARGRSLPSGVYLARLTSGATQVLRKLLLTK